MLALSALPCIGQQQERGQAGAAGPCELKPLTMTEVFSSAQGSAAWDEYIHALEENFRYYKTLSEGLAGALTEASEEINYLRCCELISGLANSPDTQVRGALL